MGTTLADVIVPEIFNPYVVKRTMEQCALLNSGIIVNDHEFDPAGTGGQYAILSGSYR